MAVVTEAVRQPRRRGRLPRPHRRPSRAPGHVALERDLFRVCQHHGEILRAFTDHFTELLDRIPRISDRIAILAFGTGVADRDFQWVIRLSGREIVAYPMLVALADKQAS